MPENVQTTLPDGETTVMTTEQIISFFHGERTNNANQEIAEPPIANLFVDMMQDFQGLIVRFSENRLRIIHEQKFRDLTYNEMAIYERIRHRRPYSPDAYRIPPVTYRYLDILMQDGIQTGIANSNEVMVDVANHSRNVYPSHGGQLHRLTEWEGHEFKQFYWHFATFWRDMWVVQELFPKGEKEERQAQKEQRYYSRYVDPGRFS
ncbi:uncharacterized protein LOC117177807 [Belonocnema kinseyi]|uniref:uncharacterized protein LOC117177807 n=1 Tax=Belonocnema kinseyi TaxID=2817044 RepID=UPI00143D1138|nr:uncharacterized protein LOC117177807 [Belonocnema kinseyi]